MRQKSRPVKEPAEKVVKPSGGRHAGNFCHGGQPKNLTGVAEICCYGLGGSKLARKSLLSTGSNQ